jgi:hypothetical protein
VPARLLPQRLDVLDPALTVAANVARFAPQAAPNAIRASNNLDRSSVRELTQALRGYRGALLVASHDLLRHDAALGETGPL